MKLGDILISDECRFRGCDVFQYCLHLQGMETVHSSETSVT
jgi:hypothetical protein